jgi:hypothetical protein
MKTTWLRAGLLLLASAPLVVGMWTLLVPHSFYDDFPLLGRDWVSTLGPYNEHLVRDVGALNLALGVLLASAAILLERRSRGSRSSLDSFTRCRTSSSTSVRTTLSPSQTTSRTWSHWGSLSFSHSYFSSARAEASRRHEPRTAVKDRGADGIPLNAGRALWRRRDG